MPNLVADRPTQHLLDAGATSPPTARSIAAAAIEKSLALGAIDKAAQVVTARMAEGDLASLADLADIFVRGTRAGVEPNGAIRLPYPQGISPGLSAAKLRHDIAQLGWRQSAGHSRRADAVLLDMLRRALFAFDGLRPEARLPWDGEVGRLALQALERAYDLTPSPRLPAALSRDWNREAAGAGYTGSDAGILVIDDFLTTRALSEIRRFCLESTIWSGNRYADGRLSALLLNGFVSPLLLQIADELRQALPGIIGTHPLRQMWGFKYTEDLPAGSTIHADCAAVNVNFWITPETANLDPASGGMTIFELEAPAAWPFSSYNRDPDAIRRHLARHRPRAIHIPYRANRAIIFNSDLFHETDAVRFAQDYENHRINITMLYGDRDATPDAGSGAVAHPAQAWRSSAFRRRR